MNIITTDIHTRDSDKLISEPHNVGGEPYEMGGWEEEKRKGGK